MTTNKETTNYTNIMALTRKNLWRLRGDLSLEEDDVVMNEETGKKHDLFKRAVLLA